MVVLISDAFADWRSPRSILRLLPLWQKPRKILKRG
jgi:hypothetical protein